MRLLCSGDRSVNAAWVCQAADPEGLNAEIGQVAADKGREEIELGRRESLKAIDESRLEKRNPREEAWVATIDAGGKGRATRSRTAGTAFGRRR